MMRRNVQHSARNLPTARGGILEAGGRGETGDSSARPQARAVAQRALWTRAAVKKVERGPETASARPQFR